MILISPRKPYKNGSLHKLLPGIRAKIERLAERIFLSSLIKVTCLSELSMFVGAKRSLTLLYEDK